MTNKITLREKCQERLRDQRAEQEAARRLQDERARVVLEAFEGFLGNVDLGTATASVEPMREESDLFRIYVRFPGGSEIASDACFDVEGGEAIPPIKQAHWKATSGLFDSRGGETKRFEDFFDAAIWLLDIELESET